MSFSAKDKRMILCLAPAVFILLTATAYFLYSAGDFNRKEAGISVKIDGRHFFRLEIAASAQSRIRGLGGRESLCEQCGMLFLFEQPARYSFRMKDMKFPLDFVWIAEDRIVGVEKNISPDYPETLAPAEPVDRVLEINAGLCDQLGIKEGSRANFFGL